jgi:hypothetical protein
MVQLMPVIRSSAACLTSPSFFNFGTSFDKGAKGDAGGINWLFWPRAKTEESSE